MASKVNRILFVAFQSGNRANGGLVSMTEIIKIISHEELFIITQDKSHFNEEWKLYGEVIVLPWVSKLPSFLSIPLFNIIIFYFGFRHKINKAYCNDIDSAIHSIVGLKLKGVKTIFSIRGVKASGQRYGLKWKIVKVLVSKILVLSNHMKETLVSRLNISPNKVHVVYSIVQKDKNSHLEVDISSDFKPIIGIPAAVYPLKQQLNFIQLGIEPILKIYPKAGFIFIGDNDKDIDYYKLCIMEAEKKNISHHVKFLGYQNEMAPWYRKFDCTLVISQREGLSRAMIESLTYGTPVVSFDVCSAREILETNKCGKVVQQGDYPRLSEAISEVISDQKNLTKNANETSSSLFTVSANKRGIENIFQEV